MPRNNHEDATAKALDLFHRDDPARSDPRLLRDAKCAEVIRATQEAAADVWLATTPLRAAPPEVLVSVMSKVEARTPLARRHVRFFPWLAASGWVAAAIAFLLWPREGEVAPAPATVERPVYLSPPPAAETTARPALRLTPSVTPVRWSQQDLLRLRARLAMLDAQGAVTAPRVLGLTSPDAVRPTPEEAQRRVVSILADALRTALEVEAGAPGDPASLVIERGWLPGGLALSDDDVIRHRNFPEDSWQEYGLLASGDGIYYDPARDLVWTRDEEGRGFIGRKSTAADDLAAFHPPDDNLAANAIAKTAPQPEGFVIEDPENEEATVIIHQVPPPAEGREQVVVWTDAAGNENSMKVESASAMGSAAATAVPATDASLVQVPGVQVAPMQTNSTLMFSLPDAVGVTSFRLIELPLVANGKPPRIIVSGDRRSRRDRLR